MKNWLIRLFTGGERKYTTMIHTLAGKTQALWEVVGDQAPNLKELGQHGIAILPQLVALMYQAQAIPASGPGRGAAKLQFVRESLFVIYSVLKLEDRFPSDWPIWQLLIDRLKLKLRSRGVI